MRHELIGFMKAAGLPLGLIDDIPKLWSMRQTQAEAPPKPVKPGKKQKLATGDLVQSEENRIAWRQRAKKTERKLLGLGRDTHGKDSQPAPGDTSAAAAAQGSSSSS